MTKTKTKRRIYQLGNEKFSSKSAVQRKASGILKTFPIDTTVEGSDKVFLMELFKLHPAATRKIGPGIKQIFVSKNKRFHNKEFKILREDDTKWDISYKQCLRTQSAHQIFSKACRYSITDQLLKFKKQTILSESESSRIKYISPFFHEIVIMFVNQENINVKKVCYKTIHDSVDDGTVQFTDQNLRQKFQDFHAQKATLFEIHF